jgi:taurine dioxygenase
VTFIETPPLGSILYGAVIPETGGDTLFADLAAAYAALSEPVRSLLDGLRATHDFQKSFRASTYYGQDNSKWESARKNNPAVSHPVVRTHPESGIKSLFVNEGFTTAIEGLNADESKTLLEFLIQHQAKPQFVYRHRWQAGRRAVLGQPRDPAYGGRRTTGRSTAACTAPPSWATGRSKPAF